MIPQKDVRHIYMKMQNRSILQYCDKSWGSTETVFAVHVHICDTLGRLVELILSNHWLKTLVEAFLQF